MSLLHGAEQWAVPEALIKLSVGLDPNRTSAIFVPVPDGIGTPILSCRAFTRDNKPINVFPLRTADGIAGFAFEAHKVDLAHIYMSDLPDTQDDYASGNFVKLIRMRSNMTARPQTADDIIRHFKRLSNSANVPPEYVHHVGEMTQHQPQEQRRGRGRGQMFGQMSHIWECIFYNAAPEISFVFSSVECPWALFIDGNSVADWQSVEKADGIITSRPLAISVGLHTLQLMCIQKGGEATPIVNILGNDSFYQNQVVPPDFSRMVQLEKQGNPTVSQCVYSPQKAYYFPHAGTTVITAHTKLNNASLVIPDENSQDSNASNPGSNGNIIPGFIIDGLEFPARPRFTIAETLTSRTNVSKLPHVISGNDSINVILSLNTTSDTMRALLKQSTLDISYISDNTVCKNANAFWNQFLHADLQLDNGPWDTVSIVTSMNNSKITETLTLKFVKPDHNLENLTFTGDNIYQNGQRAILICNVLPNAASSTAGKIHCRKLSVIDGVTGGLFGPKAEIDIKDSLQSKLPAACSLDYTPVADTDSASFECRMLKAALTTIASKPDAMLLITPLSGKPYTDAAKSDLCTILFIMQACLANGITPIPVTMPDYTGKNQETARINALLLEEMAVSLGIPLIDLHSRQIATHQKTDEWLKSGQISLETVNDNARLWIASELANGLKKIMKP